METHLTRPKSSKGRRRAIKTNTESFPERSGAPFFAGQGDGRDTFRARSQPEMRHSRLIQGQIQHEELSHRGQSLNRFKVLPSIERGRPETSPHSGEAEKTSLGLTEHFPKAEVREGTNLSTGHAPSVCSSKDDRKVALSPDTLLLAIKDPSGRRFQQHFNPTDTLLQVRASAEARFGAYFGESASIETMEVPRRSFTDLSRTLSQCGIMNKSVLCIFQHLDD